MSWDDEKDNAGRQPCTILRLYLPRCKLRYGEGDCPAVLGDDSEIKCHNTLATCPVPDSYDPETVETRLSTEQQAIPPRERIIPTITEVDSAPRRLAPGKGLGEGAEARVTVLDHPWPDYWEDYYRDERDYTPEDQGTYWGKFIARNPYYRGSRMQLLEGYISDEGFSWDDFRTREYVIDKIEGPDKRDQVTIVGTDVFRLLERERAQVPTPNTGELAGGIDEDASEFDLTPAGIGDEEYPDSFRCVIGNEGFDVTRSGDTCTIDERGLYRGLDSHESEDRVQVVRRFEGKQVHEIARDIIEEGQPDLADWVPFSEWQDEADEWLPRLYEGDITSPTGVNDLLTELMESCPVLFWPDERERKIVMEAIKPPPGTTPELNDTTHYLADTLEKKDRPKDRVDGCLVYFGMLDPTEDREDPANYSQGVYLIDEETRKRYETGQLKTIYSRWISRFNKPAAEDQARLNIRQYKETPLTIEFAIDARFSDLVLGGKVITAVTRKLQDVTGATEPRNFRVIEGHEAQRGHRIEVEAESYDFYEFGDDDGGGDDENVLTISEDEANVNFRDLYDSIYASVAEKVRIVIEEGVTIYSNSTAEFAADQGTWPDGTEIRFAGKGKIQGRPGAGGNGGDASYDVSSDGTTQDSSASPGANGSDGGPALKLRQDCILADDLKIWSGGGGGAGGGGAAGTGPLDSSQTSPYSGASHGGGGGGGAGEGTGNVPGGSGGDGQSSDGEDGSDGTTSSPGAGGSGDSTDAYGFEANAGNGGDGGAPGEPGSDGQDGSASGGSSDSGSGGAGGSPGLSIDGASYLDKEVSGDIRGPEAN